jgi:hypothetical protein
VFHSATSANADIDLNRTALILMTTATSANTATTENYARNLKTSLENHESSLAVHLIATAVAKQSTTKKEEDENHHLIRISTNSSSTTPSSSKSRKRTRRKRNFDHTENFSTTSNEINNNNLPPTRT